MQKMFPCKGGSVGDTAVKNQKQGISFLAGFDLILKSSISWDFLNIFLLSRLSLIIFSPFSDPPVGYSFGVVVPTSMN